MSTNYFLVSGTYHELRNIAREKNINPQKIRLINHPEDIYGFRDGEIIFGYTGSSRFLDDILAYARTHGFKIP